MSADMADGPAVETGAPPRGASGARRFLFSNEFGLVVLIAGFALFFAAFAPGFTTRCCANSPTAAPRSCSSPATCRR